MALNGSQGRQALSVDFNNAVTIKASVEFDIYPPDPFPNQTASGKVKETVSGRAEVTNLSLDPLDASELVDKDGLNSRHVSYKIDVSYDLGGIDQILSQALSDLYDDITPVAVAFVGPLAALTIASDENSFHSKVTAWVNEWGQAGDQQVHRKCPGRPQVHDRRLRPTELREDRKLQQGREGGSVAARREKLPVQRVSERRTAHRLGDAIYSTARSTGFQTTTSRSTRRQDQELSSALELVMPEPQDEQGLARRHPRHAAHRV